MPTGSSSVQGNLADLPAATGSFDVMLGMIYHNAGRDLARQQLMAGLATRLAHPGTAFIPGTVRYTVTGYDSAGPDPSRAHPGTTAGTAPSARPRPSAESPWQPSASSPAPTTPPSGNSYRLAGAT